MNNGLTVYNTATGVLTVTDEMKVSNSARIYNDGAVTVDDLKINSDGEFHNCENALLVVNDECELERSTAIYQRGRASIEEMTARGTIWVNCHTSVNELEAQGRSSISARMPDSMPEGLNSTIRTCRWPEARSSRWRSTTPTKRAAGTDSRLPATPIKGRGPDFGEGVYPQRA